MKAVIQRVSSASVSVNGTVLSQIPYGYVVLLGIMKEDTNEDLSAMAKKIKELRIIQDENGKMNKSIADIQGSVLLISQFTLCADTRKGRRPSFLDAKEPQQAKHMYEQLGETLEKEGIPVFYGSFGDHMEVSLMNDGPVTILLDTKVTS